MIADLDATGLIERSAAAYASGVPDEAADDGFFGPASVTWRMSADLALPVAGLRSLLMQALHPLAMAGVDQHSGWRRDPVGRLAATSAYLTTVTFGDQDAALRAASRVRHIHARVRGTDSVTGRAYAAGDPALLLWVHASLVDSVLAAGSLVGISLSAGNSDRYVAEMVAAAELAGVPRSLVPSSVPALDLYIASVRPGRFFDLRSPVAGYISVPQPYVILQRINLGLFAVLGELSATADWRAISEEIWPFVQGPAATPLGEAEVAWRTRHRALSPTAS